MADVNVDKMVHNEFAIKEWKKNTINIMRAYSFKTALDLFLDSANDYAKRYTNKNIPRYVFTGERNVMDIADDFNVKPIGAKLRVCPFHKDKDPSLSLSAEKNVFNCFGCGIKGNIFTFYGELKKLRGKKNVNKKRIS